MHQSQKLFVRLKPLPSKSTAPSGQAVIEYVLLLALASVLAVLLTNSCTRQASTPQESGALLQRWQAVKEAIGRDEPVSPGAPN